MAAKLKRNDEIELRFGLEAHDAMQAKYGFTGKTKVEVIKTPLEVYHYSTLEDNGDSMTSSGISEKRFTIEFQRWVNAKRTRSWIVGYSPESDLFVIRERGDND